MIECKFSLELTKNGVQRSIHAKKGEENGRKAVITLTEAGEVFDPSEFSLRMYFDDGTYSDAVQLINGCIEFVFPAGLVAAAGERLCELKLSKGSSSAIYSPIFSVLVEAGIGASAEDAAKPIGSPVKFQEIIPDLPEGNPVLPNDEIAVYSSESKETGRKKISDLPFGEKFENEDVLKLIGANGDSITFNGSEISSDPQSVTLQTLVALMAADHTRGYASVESPETASTENSNFYYYLSLVGQSEAVVYYAPPSSSQLIYLDPTTRETKTENVKKGNVYSFSVDWDAYALQIRTLSEADDVKTLFDAIHSRYAKPSDIPQKFSELENDRGFVSKTTVTEMITEALENEEDTPILQEPIDANVDWAEALINTETANVMVIECSLLPVNARVKKIEIPDVVNDTDEYISLEDMASKDPNGFSAPYYIMYPKNTQGGYFTAAAIVVFTNMPNEFYNSATANLFDNKTIKIHYEIEV